MRIELDQTGTAADRCFEALADERRRRIIAALCEAEASLSLTGLAVELTRAETDPKGGPGPDVEDRKVQLYHRHIPKLADAGLVEFDRDRRRVALAPGFEGIEDTSELLAA
jgi:DNA-binding transcriptional ArsR family regulator